MHLFLCSEEEKKTARKLQTSAGNKQWMRRNDSHIFHRTQAVVFVFRGSSDEGASDCAVTRTMSSYLFDEKTGRGLFYTSSAR